MIGGSTGALSEGVVGGNGDNGHLEISGDGDLLLTIAQGTTANAGIGHGTNIKIDVRSLNIDLSTIETSQLYGIFNEQANEVVNVKTTDRLEIKAYGDAIYNNADNALTTLTSSDGAVILDGEVGIRGLKGKVEVSGKNVQIGNSYSTEIRKAAVSLDKGNKGLATISAQDDLTIEDKSVGKKSSAINVYSGVLTLSSKNTINVVGDIVSTTNSKDFAAKEGAEIVVADGNMTVTNGTVSDYRGQFTLSGGSLTLSERNGFFGGNVNVNGGTLTVQGDAVIADGNEVKVSNGGTANFKQLTVSAGIPTGAWFTVTNANATVEHLIVEGQPAEEGELFPKVGYASFITGEEGKIELGALTNRGIVDFTGDALIGNLQNEAPGTIAIVGGTITLTGESANSNLLIKYADETDVNLVVGGNLINTGLISVDNLTVEQGTVDNSAGQLAVVKDLTIGNGGKVSTSASLLTADANEALASGQDPNSVLSDPFSYVFGANTININEGGTLELTSLNSNYELGSGNEPEEGKTYENDQYLIQYSVNLNGGALTVKDSTDKLSLKVGTQAAEATLNVTKGEYAFGNLTVGNQGTVTVSGGSLAVDALLSNGGKASIGETGTLVANTLTLTDGEVDVLGNATVNSDITVANGKLTVSEGGIFTSEGTVTNDGTLTVKEDASFITTGNIANNSTAAVSGTLGAGDLANAGTIDAAAGTVIVTGTLDNTGSLTAKNLQVANGTDSGEFNVANLTALATDGEGFKLTHNDSFESVAVNEDGRLTAENLTVKMLTSNGRLTAETLKVGAGSETGEFNVKSLTVEGGEFKLGAARKFDTALNINADGKLSSDFEVESKTISVAETGTIDTMGLKAESFSNAGTASLGIVEADAITNTGSIAAAEVSANTFKSTGSFKADELKVGNGSESGTFDVTKLTVNGNFSLGGNRSFNTLNIAEGATLNAEELEVFGNETKLAGAMTADTLAVTTLELTGDLTAGILSVNSGFDDGNTVEVDNLFVNESKSGFELRKDREFVVVEVKEDALLTAGNLTVNDAIVNGTLKADTLNVANGEAGAGLSVKNLIVTGPTVVSEDDEESVFSLTSSQSFESLAVEKAGVLEALDITARTVSADGSVTAGKLTISGELKGVGTLTLSEVAIGEKASLSSFTGIADLSAGKYKLTDGSAWFGGSVTLRGTALADVTELSDSEKVLGKLTVDGGSLTALSAQIFNTGLGDEGKSANPESVKTEANLSEGILTLDDKIYNLKYADNAASLLNQDGSSMRLVFTGTLYKEPAPETPPATDSKTDNITVDDIIGGSSGESGSGGSVSSEIIYAGATLDATKNTDSDLPNSNPDNLVIGSVSQVVADGETQAQEVDKSLGVKNVAVSDKADMVAINNNRTLTLVGGSVDDTGTSNNLILSGSQNITLQVGGSQTAGVLELGVKTEGVANHGTINAALNIKAAGKMFVNAGTFVAEQDVNTEGEISISEGANLSAQQNVTVEKGAVVTVDGELSVENKNDTESSAQLTMKTGSTLAVNGKATIDKIELNSADAQDKDHGIITIGNKDKAGTAVIKSLGDNHDKLRIFLDPAWNATDGTIEQASSLVLNTETFDGDLIVGQNSYAVFGSEADRADLLAKFRSAEMTWGEADTTALVYAPGTIDLGTTGRIIVNGAYTTISDADNAPAGKAVYVAPNGVLVANADTSLIKASGRSDFKVLFDEGSTLLLDKVTAQTNVFNIFDGAEVTRTGAMVKATNAFFDLAWKDDDNGSVTVTLNTANNEYSGLMQGADLAGSAMSQPDTDEYRYADGILTHYGLDRAGGAAAFDAAMNPMGALATYTTAFDRTSELKNVVRDEAGSVQEPRLWVRMTGGKTKLDGISTGSQSLSVKTETFGVIAGGEASVADTVLGAAFAAGTGSTRNNAIGGKDSFSYYGLSAYAQRKLGGISFTADLSGTWLKSEVSAGGVIDVSNDADTSVYTFGLEAKQSFDVSGMALTPFVGLDVYRICSDDLTTKHGVKIESAHATAVEVPIGARAAMDFTTTDGTRVRPTFSLAVVPTFGDRDIDVATRFAGAKSNLNFTFADDVKVRSNLGITAEKKNVRFGLDLGYEWGNEGRSASNLMLRANFAF